MFECSVRSYLSCYEHKEANRWKQSNPIVAIWVSVWVRVRVYSMVCGNARKMISLSSIASNVTQNIAYCHEKVRWIIPNSVHTHSFHLPAILVTCVILLRAIRKSVRWIVCERMEMPIALWCHQHNNSTCDYWAREKRANESSSGSRWNRVPFTQNLFCMRIYIIDEVRKQHWESLHFPCRLQRNTHKRARSLRWCGIESHIDSDFRIGEYFLFLAILRNNNWVFS